MVILIILVTLWYITVIELFFLQLVLLIFFILSLFSEFIAHRSQHLTLIEYLNGENILLNGNLERSLEPIGAFMELLVETDQGLLFTVGGDAQAQGKQALFCLRINRGLPARPKRLDRNRDAQAVRRPRFAKRKLWNASLKARLTSHPAVNHKSKYKLHLYLATCCILDCSGNVRGKTLIGWYK